MQKPTAIATRLDEVMRSDGGRLLAVLIVELRDFQRAEDCLQEALASALKHWPTSGMPLSPQAWLLQSARRKAIDQLRRASNFNAKAEQLAYLIELDQTHAEDATVDDFPDDRLKLIFTCCHPALDEVTRIALTLRTLGGLSTQDIARAFLVSEDAMAQRLVRARHKIVKAGIGYEVPDRQHWPERFTSVLDVIYLIFNEGYASRAEPYVRDDLMQEAVRLARIILRLQPGEAEAEGLLALLLLHHARVPARLDSNGHAVPLDEQNRTLWQPGEISEGLALVETAMRRAKPGPYQIQAAISACHAEANSTSATDWQQIVLLYGELAKHKNNPVIEINRIAALSYAEGPASALEMLDKYEPELKAYQPFLALKADLLRRLNHHGARAAYDCAIAQTQNAYERGLLSRRRDLCHASEPVADR